ncbi:tyrosine-type recombinase/integrase [Spirosoma jeollabukense]
MAFNQTILYEYHKAEVRLLDLQRKKLPISAEAVFEEQRDQTGLIAAAKAYIERMRGRGSYHSAEKYLSHVHRIEQFQKEIDISLDEVTEDWILKFARWLKENGTKSDNTLRKRMQFLATIFEDARKRGLTANDPLKLLEFPKAQTRKPRLTAEQLATLETMELNGTLALTRDTFLLQFYLYGSRISDVLLLRPSDIKTGAEWRVEYTSLKTGDLISVPLRGKARIVVERYYDPTQSYLLPWMKKTEQKAFTIEQNTKWVGDEVESKSAQINFNLKEIARLAGFGVNLTTHVARHTFARLADSKVADKRKISAALGHSKFSTTEEYLEDLRMSDLDEDMAGVYE